MFKKKAIYIFLFFIVLILLVIGIEYFKKAEPVIILPEILIEADIDAIDELWILPEFNENYKVRIFKTEAGEWVMDGGDGRPVDISQDVLKSSLDHLNLLIPFDIAGSTAEEWQKYKVDSNGTLLRVFSQGELMASLVIGRLDTREAATAVTYVRVEDEEETYIVDLYLETSLKAYENQWRNNVLISGAVDNWKQIYIDYGNEGGYTLYHVDNNWLLGDIEIDEKLINEFLEGFILLKNDEFVTELYSEDLYRPVLRADFISHDGSVSSLNVYNTDHGRVITSTTNMGNVMKADDAIVNAIYYPRSYFLD